MEDFEAFKGSALCGLQKEFDAFQERLRAVYEHAQLLEQQNVDLRSKLESKQLAGTEAQSVEASSKLSARGGTDIQNLHVDTIESLRAQLATKDIEYARLVNAHGIIRARYDEMRRRQYGWQKYLEKSCSRLKEPTPGAVFKSHEQPGLPIVMPGLPSSGRDHLDGPMPTSDETSRESADKQMSSPPRLAHQHARPSNNVILPPDAGSDSPEVVSVRAVKRKRQPVPKGEKFSVQRDKHSPPIKSEAVHVKSEQGSSSPARPLEVGVTGLVSDSLDLDEVRMLSYTPVKRRRVRHSLSPSVRKGRPNLGNQDDNRRDTNDCGRSVFVHAGEETGQRQRAQEELDAQLPGVSRRSLHHLQEQTKKSRRSGGGFPNPKLSFGDGIIAVENNHKENASKPSSTKQKRGGQVTSSFNHPGALQPKTPNARVLPRKIDNEKTGAKADMSRGADNIGTVAEDGDVDGRTGPDPGARSDNDGIPCPPTTKSTEVFQRLETLLAAPSPGKPRLSPIKSAKATPRPQNAFQRPGQQRIGTPQNQQDGGRGRAAEKAMATPGQSVRGPSSTKPAPLPRPFSPAANGSSAAVGPPLRSRPVSALRVEDFKVNPASNDGLDYAYSSVVRSKAQRQCLPNCTKPACCGAKFQKFVAAAGMPGPPRRTAGLFDPSPPQSPSPAGGLDADKEKGKEGGEDEEGLLREYLGAHAAGRMVEYLSGPERRDLLEKARAKAFADRFGRHRLAQHPRAASPEGFWRVDMPSTQEAETDRERARARERRRVEERYREATREGGIGRWMFRDE